VSILLRLLAGRRTAAFIGQDHAVTNGFPQSLSFGSALAGDLGILFTSGAAAVAPSGWTQIGTLNWSALATDVYAKQLDASDIATGHVTTANTANGGLAVLMIYRSASTASVVSSQTGSSTSLDIPGFTQNALCAGVLTYANDSTPSGGTITAPSGTASRLRFGSSAGSIALADILPGVVYPNGTHLVWTAMSGSANGGQIIQLT
jgi:hypothetical protein